MKLLEHEGKTLFKKSGIKIPRGILISSVKELNKIKTPCILKAQVLSGKRGKSGLIKKFKKNETAQAKAFAKQLFKKKVFSILSEQLIPIMAIESSVGAGIDGKTEVFISVVSSSFLMCVASLLMEG